MASSFSFRLPSEDKGALKVLGTMEPSQFESLVSALHDAEPSLTPKRMAEQLAQASALSSMAVDLPAVSRVLVNLGRAIYLDNLTLFDVTASLAEYAIEEKLIEDETSQNALRTRLEELFSLDTVKLSSKANAVLTSHPYTFGAARIFTEIRPLFNDDVVVSAPRASVIAHQLRIDALHNGDNIQIFVAMDDSDLRMLRNALERAMGKSAVLVEQERQQGRTVVTEQD